MRRIFLAFFCSILALGVFAQKEEYQTFIYTSDDLADLVSSEANKQREQNQRGFWGDLGKASLSSVNGIASGYVTSFLDLGVNAIGNILTRNSRNKAEWEKIIAKEDTFVTHIRTISEVNDFYNDKSNSAAMDPKGMKFDGIGCLKMEDSDTAFYISCHIDRAKIHRIINHSKFELVLDTLVISPSHSHLPNSPHKRSFSFDERKDFTLSMIIKLFSSWMTEVAQINKDEQLGEFTITIPVNPNDLDKKGYLRYIRKGDEPSAHRIIGESFIVPRSFMGYRDNDNNYQNSWGTGEYKLDITIKETCDVTDEFRKNWKKDYQWLQKQQKEKNFFKQSWQSFTHQKWDELTKSWIITTLKGPADVIENEANKILGIKQASTSVSAQGSVVQTKTVK